MVQEVFHKVGNRINGWPNTQSVSISKKKGFLTSKSWKTDTVFRLLRAVDLAIHVDLLIHVDQHKVVL